MNKVTSFPLNKEKTVLTSLDGTQKGIKVSPSIRTIVFKEKNMTPGEEKILIPIKQVEDIVIESLKGTLCLENIVIDSLKISGINSSIYLKNLTIKKDAKISTCVGDINLCNCKIGSSLIASTSLGNISGTKLVAEDTDINLGEGKVNLFSGETKKLSVKSSYGNIKLKDMSMLETVNVKLWRGSVEMNGCKSLETEEYNGDHKTLFEISSGTCTLLNSIPRNILITGSSVDVHLSKESVKKKTFIKIKRVLGTTTFY